MSEPEDKRIVAKALELAKKVWFALLLMGFLMLVLGLLPGFSLGQFKPQPLDPQGRYTAICVGLVLMGLGVFAGFREGRAELNAEEAKGYGFEVTAPSPAKVRADFRIEGKCKKLPKQPEENKWGILEVGGTSGDYWRKAGVEVDEENKTWKSDLIPFNNSRSERQFVVVVMSKSKGGQVIYEYQKEVTRQIRAARERLKLSKEDLPVPGWRGRPAGMFECARIIVQEL